MIEDDGSNNQNATWLGFFKRVSGKFEEGKKSTADIVVLTIHQFY